jgi:two-component sensor histidine kinase
VVVEDLPNTREFRIHPVLAEHGIISLLNVPIVFDGASWGVLEVDSAEPRIFSDTDIEFLQAMASLLAGALQRDAARSRLEAAASDAAVRLERQAMLLRELQHRAKNNLQIVVSMLAQERRAAIALAHNRLSDAEAEGSSAGRGATDLAGYLRALLGSLELSFGTRIVIEASLDACSIAFDKAVAAGLIVNELVTNAAKHAYPPEQEGGVVRVSLACDLPNAEATLSVADEGRGMPEESPDAAERRAQRRHGQGTELIQLLARQLGGEVERLRPERGTRTLLRFPLVG